MSYGRTLRTILGTALLASAPALLPGPAAAAPKAMIVLSSVAYDSAEETAYAVATDASENVYITGASDSNLHTVKYSKLLVSPVVRPFAGSTGRGITTDSLGNIIVVGERSNGSNLDYLTLKYNPGFTALISSALFNSGGGDAAAAVRVDSQNNIFVTGASNNGSNNDFYTIKYSPSLNILSTAAYESGSRDDATALAVDHSDNIIVVGYSGIGAANNFYIQKYDNNLAPLQQASFDGGNVDQALGVAVDSLNNIIVTGSMFDGTGFNYLTRKYDAFLNFISSAVYDSGAAVYDIPNGVAVDSNDNIIVTGQSGIGPAQDYFTIKYDANLAVVSSSTHNGGNTDKAMGIAVDASDNVIVTGTSYNGATNDYYTIKYNASPKIKVVSPLYIGETYDVTVDGNGFLASSSVTFADAGISTGAISFVTGQLRVSATLSAAVMLGVTTVTVSNLNGEEVSNYTLASTRLRRTITANSAGVLAAPARAGQVVVDIPAGTFPFQELVTIYTLPAIAGNPSPVGEAVRLDVSPAGTPQQDITVTLHYDPADLGTYSEFSLSLAYFSTSNVWVPLTGSVVDAAANSVSAPTRFVNTEYAIVKEAQGSGGGGGGGAGGSGIPAKVYPNPYRPGSGGSFDQSTMGEGIVFAGLGANKSINLTIVDVAGQLVYQKSAAADAAGKYLWDTKTVSGGKAATGVYIYLITGGAEPLKGKFSIIR